MYGKYHLKKKGIQSPLNLEPFSSSHWLLGQSICAGNGFNSQHFGALKLGCYAVVPGVIDAAMWAILDAFQYLRYPSDFAEKKS